MNRWFCLDFPVNCRFRRKYLVTYMFLLLKITMVYHTSSTEVRHYEIHYPELKMCVSMLSHSPVSVLTAPCKQGRYNHPCVTLRPHTSTRWNGLRETTAPKPQTGSWTSIHGPQPDVEPNSRPPSVTLFWPTSSPLPDLYRGLSVCWHWSMWAIPAHELWCWEEARLAIMSFVWLL